jgi:hypothetical protein
LPVFSTLDGSIDIVFLNASRVFAQTGIHGDLASFGRNPGGRPFIGQIYKISSADKSSLSYASGGSQSSPQFAPPSPAFERHFAARDDSRASPGRESLSARFDAPATEAPEAPATRKGSTRSQSSDSARSSSTPTIDAGSGGSGEGGPTGGGGGNGLGGSGGATPTVTTIYREPSPADIMIAADRTAKSIATLSKARTTYWQTLSAVRALAGVEEVNLDEIAPTTLDRLAWTQDHLNTGLQIFANSVLHDRAASGNFGAKLYGTLSTPELFDAKCAEAIRRKLIDVRLFGLEMAAGIVPVIQLAAYLLALMHSPGPAPATNALLEAATDVAFVDHNGDLAFTGLEELIRVFQITVARQTRFDIAPVYKAIVQSISAASGARNDMGAARWQRDIVVPTLTAYRLKAPDDIAIVPFAKDDLAKLVTLLDEFQDTTLREHQLCHRPSRASVRVVVPRDRSVERRPRSPTPPPHRSYAPALRYAETSSQARAPPRPQQPAPPQASFSPISDRVPCWTRGCTKLHAQKHVVCTTCNTADPEAWACERCGRFNNTDDCRGAVNGCTATRSAADGITKTSLALILADSLAHAKGMRRGNGRPAGGSDPSGFQRPARRRPRTMLDKGMRQAPRPEARSLHHLQHRGSRSVGL